MTQPDAPASPGRSCSSRLLRDSAVVLAVLLALAGCASTPQAPAGEDALAKQFLTHPDSATLYVYRPDRSPSPDSEDTLLYVDDRLIGATLPGTYFRIDLLPGVRRLHGMAHDNGSLNVNIRRGEITFVALIAFNGSSYFARVAPEAGKHELVRCCELMENWTPGQRPLLR